MIEAIQTIALAMIVGGTGGLGLGGGIGAIPPADPIRADPKADLFRQNVLRLRIDSLREIERLRREASKPRPEFGEFQEKVEQRYRDNFKRQLPLLQKNIQFAEDVLDWLEYPVGEMPQLLKDPRKRFVR